MLCSRLVQAPHRPRSLSLHRTTDWPRESGREVAAGGGTMGRRSTRTGLTRRELLQALGVSGAAVVIAGCAPGTTGGGPSPSVGATAAAGTPVKGGSVTLALSGNITTLDPRIAGTNNANRTPTHVFTNTMIRLNEKLQYVPELAESWTRSTDGLNWTFKLRKDVKFHDGS